MTDVSAPSIYLVRVWLPDRPGSLGTVASRIGGLKGDVIGLEILERGGGQAIDELVVSLPSAVPKELIVKELNADDGVKVEDIRKLNTYDPELDVLEAASAVLEAKSAAEIAAELCAQTCRILRANWSCLLPFDGAVLASCGDPPNDSWLRSFVAASPAVTDRTGEDLRPVLDAVWAFLPSAHTALVVGRNEASGPAAFRSRERRRLAALANLADAWWGQVVEPAVPSRII